MTAKTEIMNITARMQKNVENLKVQVQNLSPAQRQTVQRDINFLDKAIIDIRNTCRE